MPIFTNFATLSYSGGITNSNTVTGQLLETLAATKIAVMDDYVARDDVTYVISIINSGTTPFTDLTVRDDLGGYDFEGTTVYPLAYVEGSVHLYVNGVLQPDPVVEAGPPLTISGINVPAGGNAMLIYETEVTAFAPLDAEATIVNTATITGGGISTPIVASETIGTEDRADLTVSKALSPEVVTENGQLTYTFVIANAGNTPAVATDDVILTDTFDPILNPITVVFNGVTWVEGVNYTYDETTGEFATLPGQITVPAATYTQNGDGTWTVTPGTAVLTVTGTV